MLILYAQGMTVYDAMCHAFGTMATGGYSTKNASVGQYGSAGIDWTITIFMILAGTNFGLYFKFFSGEGGAFHKDSEWKFYTGMIAVASAVVTVDLMSTGIYDSVLDGIRYAAF